MNNEVPVAIRRLSRTNTGEKLIVRIFQPYADGSNDWACPVTLEFEAGSMLEEKLCWGADAIQALQIAFSYIRSKVGEEFLWMGEPAVLGFPASLPNTFGIDFYRSMVSLTSEAEAEFVRSHQQTKGS